jgi:hypothetical protein
MSENNKKSYSIRHVILAAASLGLAGYALYKYLSNHNEIKLSSFLNAL